MTLALEATGLDKPSAPKGLAWSLSFASKQASCCFHCHPGGPPEAGGWGCGLGMGVDGLQLSPALQGGVKGSVRRVCLRPADLQAGVSFGNEWRVGGGNHRQRLKS